jgi:hypothetical protein
VETPQLRATASRIADSAVKYLSIQLEGVAANASLKIALECWMSRLSHGIASATDHRANC